MSEYILCAVRQQSARDYAVFFSVLHPRTCVDLYIVDDSSIALCLCACMNWWIPHQLLLLNI